MVISVDRSLIGTDQYSLFQLHLSISIDAFHTFAGTDFLISSGFSNKNRTAGAALKMSEEG